VAKRQRVVEHQQEIAGSGQPERSADPCPAQRSEGSANVLGMVCGDLTVEEIKSDAEQKKRQATSQIGRETTPGGAAARRRSQHRLLVDASCREPPRNCWKIVRPGHR